MFIKPQTPGPIFRGELKKEIKEVEQPFKFNERFLIVSTDTKLQLIDITKKNIVLKYVDVEKDDIITTAENLTKSLKMGIFIRI